MNLSASRLIGLLLGLVIAGVAAALALELITEYSRTGSIRHLVLLGGMAGAGWLLMKAAPAILPGQGAERLALADRVAELESRLEEVERRGLTSGEVEQVYAQFAEMESRMEFTERLLAVRAETEFKHGAPE